MTRLFFAALLAVTVSGCASNGRVVQISEIQNRLKQKGFRVLRWSSRTRVSEQTSATRTESYNQAEARYVLVIDGYAPYDWVNRCFAGGYKFDHISTDLVDTVTNETILNINGSGFSENCPPMSGTIFSDIANAIDAAWAK